MLPAFGLLSLAAVGLGAFVAARHGVPTGSWARNLAAWLVGAVAALALARTLRPAALPVLIWLAPLGLMATLVSPAVDGVHRWVDLGPLHINVAMLLLPVAIVAAASLLTVRTFWPLGVLLLCVGGMIVQPDASQATSLAVVGAAMALPVVRRPAARAGVVAAFVALAGVAWLRPDPLQPVAEVEEILGLAFRLSPLAGGIAVALLAAIAATPVVLARGGGPAPWTAGLALGLCFLMWAVAPLLGAFPVPFVGIGMSAILGGWLGIGALAGVMRWEARR